MCYLLCIPSLFGYTEELENDIPRLNVSIYAELNGLPVLLNTLQNQINKLTDFTWL
ncbi:MAG: hypothetical protein ACI9IT_000916 [Glaciecola sp.]|jgi:hypothetical protein